MLSKLRLRASSFFSNIVTALKFKPVHYTFMGLLFSLLYLAAMYRGDIILGILFILLSGLMDVLDGLAARIVYGSSRFGAFLDSVFDRIEDGVYVIGLLFIVETRLGSLMVVTMLILTLLIPYVSARARSLRLNTSNETSIMERPDRIILLTITLVAYIVGGNNICLYVMLLYIILALYNILHNIYYYH